AILGQHYGKDWDKIASILEVVQRNGIKLQDLIEEILVLSKLEAQSLELEESLVEFFPFIRRLFLAFEAQAHLQGIKLRLNYELEQGLNVWLDESKLESKLLTIFSNLRWTSPRFHLLRYGRPKRPCG
ncbi:MAG: hypothetical protein AAF517_15990, partial [Planctomycetota bacterium]